MRTEPEVSVLLPARQVDPHLHTALRSLALQTFKAFELVVVAPAPAHADMQAACAALGLPWVRCIADPGKGLAAALNAGLRECRAALVARMDGDDECLPHRLQAQLQAFREQPSLQVLGSGATLVDALGQAIGQRGPAARQRLHTRDLLFSNPLVHPSVMFRRQCVMDAGLYAEDALAEDYELWIRLAAADAHMEVLPERLLNYRIHGSQLSLSAAGARRCNQIAQALRTRLGMRHPWMAPIAAVVWRARGTVVALRARRAAQR